MWRLVTCIVLGPVVTCIKYCFETSIKYVAFTPVATCIKYGFVNSALSALNQVSPKSVTSPLVATATDFISASKFSPWTTEAAAGPAASSSHVFSDDKHEPWGLLSVTLPTALVSSSSSVTAAHVAAASSEIWSYIIYIYNLNASEINIFSSQNIFIVQNMCHFSNIQKLYLIIPEKIVCAN